MNEYRRKIERDEETKEPLNGAFPIRMYILEYGKMKFEGVNYIDGIPVSEYIQYIG